MSSMLVILGIIALLSLLIYHKCFRNKDAMLSRLPPGPKPLPIVGNILDLPPAGTAEFQHWLKFKDTYGPISSVTVLGQTMIILHDKQAASDIMEKMSMKTSNRPRMPFANELCGLAKFLPSQQYANAARFASIQDVESRRLLYRILGDPKNSIRHFKTATSAIILKATYGYSVDPHKSDPLVKLIEDMMGNFSRAMVPLSWMVDIASALRHLPDWFPGTAFKETSRRWNRVNYLAATIPFSFVRRQVANGTHRPSYVSSHIEQQVSGDGSKSRGLDLDAIKWTAGIMYAGGADTTVISLSAFALAMMMFPEAQHKAQKEIDSVIGTDRLPQFEDREILPYTSALIKEVIRWFNITSINTVHTTDQEIFYGGYRIPEGSYLLASTWWFLHDPQTYPDPMSFSLERFLEPRNEPDPAEAFGWGRRICPGRFFADASLFITIARMLATLHITKAVDAQGRQIEPKLEYTPGLNTTPGDFQFNITVRSERHAELIRTVEVDHPWEKSDVVSLLNRIRVDCESRAFP